MVYFSATVGDNEKTKKENRNCPDSKNLEPARREINILSSPHLSISRFQVLMNSTPNFPFFFHAVLICPLYLKKRYISPRGNCIVFNIRTGFNSLDNKAVTFAIPGIHTPRNRQLASGKQECCSQRKNCP
jgi:hypothetical protein